MILVAGSTGRVGRQICRNLLGRGNAIRALVRPGSDEAVVRDLRARGAELAVGDVRSRASLRLACRYVRAVISTVSSTFSSEVGNSIDTVDYQGQLNLIDAATKAGVGRFIFLSFNHQRMPLPSPLAEAKSAAEQRIMASGMEYTIVRASFFMDVWLSEALGFDPQRGTAMIYGAGENAISWIAASDVAAFVVATVDNPAARNQLIELGGPEALSPLEVVRVFEETGGGKLEVEHVSTGAIRAQRERDADPMQQSFDSLMLAYAAGDVIDNAHAMRVCPMPLKSVRQYAEETIGGPSASVRRSWLRDREMSSRPTTRTAS